MCFSATASFTAAGVLACVGIGAVYESLSKRTLMLALMPLLFAIQQFSEGVAWLTVANLSHHYCHYVSTQAFMLFAFIIWPIWIPLAFYFAEIQKNRKRLIAISVVLGTIVGVYGLTEFHHYHAAMTVLTDHVYYGVGFTPRMPVSIYLPIYVIATMFPPIFSSLEWSKIILIVATASFIFTYIFMHAAFTSVWCFFCAILSILFLLVVKDNQLQFKSSDV